MDGLLITKYNGLLEFDEMLFENRIFYKLLVLQILR